METLKKLEGQTVIAVNRSGETIVTGFLFEMGGGTGKFRICDDYYGGPAGLYFQTADVEKIVGNTIHFRPFC